MFVIFPFEEKLYREAGLPCDFVGHPLLDILPEPAPNKALAPPLKVGLLPGSRASEIKRHLPVFLKAFALLRQNFPDAEAHVFAAPAQPDSAYDISSEPRAKIVREADYQTRASLDIAFCSSGTATLENALLGVPMVVVYKMFWPTYAVARAIIRVKNIAMANILAGKTLVPELIQSEATPEGVARAALGLLEDPRRYMRLRDELLSLRAQLGTPGSAERAAQAILRDLG